MKTEKKKIKPKISITHVQKLNLELIKLASFNGFNGPGIARELLKHKDKWDAVVMDRCSFSSKKQEVCIDLIKLRDIPENYWSVDDLFILCKPGEEAAIAALGAEWGADRCEIWDVEKTQHALGFWDKNDKRKIVDFWWD